MKSRVLTCAVCAVVFGLSVVAPAAPAQAAQAAQAKKYSSCAKVHVDWSGGIAKPGVTMNRLSDGTKVPLGGVVKHSKALYEKNFRNLDRDRDGVACEV